MMTMAGNKGLVALVALFVFAADRVTKYRVLSLGARVRYNRGVSFGLFSSVPPVLLIAVLFLCVLLLAVVFLRFSRVGLADRLALYGMAAASGGGAGNVADRLLGRGVVDWIRLPLGLPFMSELWINIADVAICAGALMIFVSFARARLR